MNLFLRRGPFALRLGTTGSLLTLVAMGALWALLAVIWVALLPLAIGARALEGRTRDRQRQTILAARLAEQRAVVLGRIENVRIRRLTANEYDVAIPSFLAWKFQGSSEGQAAYEQAIDRIDHLRTATAVLCPTCGARDQVEGFTCGFCGEVVRPRRE